MIGKLMGLATVGSSLANVTLLHRFLASATSVVALTMISAFMCCVLLIGIFGATYISLVHYGLDPYAAAITVALIMIIMTGGCVSLTIIRLRQLREIPHHNMHRDIPGMSHISSIADAFMKGFLKSPDIR
jgi:hypothetical protein